MAAPDPAQYRDQLRRQRRDLVDQIASARRDAETAVRTAHQLTDERVGVRGELAWQTAMDVEAELDLALRALRNATRAASEGMDHFNQEGDQS